MIFGKNNKKIEEHGKWNEIQAVILFAAALLVFLSLLSFSFSDLPRFTSNPNVPIKNLAGLSGAYIGAALLFIMGFSAYVIPFLILSWGIARLYNITPQKILFKLSGTFFLVLASSAFFSMFGGHNSSLRFSLGGISGLIFSDFLIKYLGRGGALLVIGVLFVLSLLLATEFLLLPFLSGLFRRVAGLPSDIKNAMAGASVMAGRQVSGKRIPVKSSEKAQKIINADSNESVISKSADIMNGLRSKIARVKDTPPKIIISSSKPDNKKADDTKKDAALKHISVAPVRLKDVSGYEMPSCQMLSDPPQDSVTKEDFEATARILEDTLREFDIEGKVVEINNGPVITLYELEPAPGVNVHRITSLSDNITLAMKAQSVRIVAPIPGKGTIGFEVPNSKNAIVYLKNVLESKEYRLGKSVLKLALGKDIAGTPIVADLTRMPHLLIAGTTGSGKSVCINSIIMSILFNAGPDEVKFIMVDPKRVELSIFNGLPHLLSPVVTDVKKAAGVLAWVASEMDSRYELLEKHMVKNIHAYNEKFSSPSAKLEEGQSAYLPYIVVVIDELADMMMVARDDVEKLITRIAQLSRAVGIHMIIATQRPSVDVITGVIKANLPARIAFKVASKVDSRTVLDMNGADLLLGRGDMLFIEPGAHKPARGQCSLISDKEIESVVNFIKAQRSPQYIEEIGEAIKKTGSFKKFDKDEVYEEAVRLILESKQASVSVLQRRLGLGYTRAARLIDMMEDEGIVGPYQGSKPRDLLITLEEYGEKNAVKE